jgi:hypothetical protein
MSKQDVGPKALWAGSSRALAPTRWTQAGPKAGRRCRANPASLEIQYDEPPKVGMVRNNHGWHVAASAGAAHGRQQAWKWQHHMKYDSAPIQYVPVPVDLLEVGKTIPVNLW